MSLQRMSRRITCIRQIVTSSRRVRRPGWAPVPILFALPQVSHGGCRTGGIMDMETVQRDYERDGVVRVKGLLSPDQLAEAREAVQRYMREKLSELPPGDRTFEQDGVTVRNLWRMEKYDDYFARLA